METRIIEINPKELKLLELNARYMKHEEYTRLVANIKRDGKLTSAPFACWDGDAYLVLSGNHRTKASIEAGLESIHCIVTDEELSKDQKIAIQLSHNSIVGQDDPFLLKQLYEKILDVDMKEYSGLDDKTLELLDKFNTFSMSEANLKFQTLTMVFLPDDFNAAKEVISKAIAESKSADEIWLARYAEYDKWLDSQEIASSAYNVKNVATAVDLVLRVFERNMDQLYEAYENTENNKYWVPIESVIGRAKIPAESAKIIRKALDRMVTKDEITSKNLWQGLEYLCADYIAGDK